MTQSFPKVQLRKGKDKEWVDALKKIGFQVAEERLCNNVQIQINVDYSSKLCKIKVTEFLK